MTTTIDRLRIELKVTPGLFIPEIENDSARQTSPGPLEVGAKGEWFERGESEATLTVVEHDPPRLFELRADSEYGAARIYWRLVPEAGGTRTVCGYEMDQTKFVEAHPRIDRTKLETNANKLWETCLTNLKRNLEEGS